MFCSLTTFLSEGRLSQNMGDIATILEMIEELQEMIMQYTNGELPPDYRVGNQTGEEAYLRVIYNPLMDIESTLLHLY